MNENMILNPGETIIFMAGSYGRGKAVHETRVFATVEEFLDFVRTKGRITEMYPGKCVGDVVHQYTITYGAKKGHRKETILTQPGYIVSYYGQFYVASPSEAPKRFDATPEMLGYVSAKTKVKTIKPST